MPREGGATCPARSSLYRAGVVEGPFGLLDVPLVQVRIDGRDGGHLVEVGFDVIDWRPFRMYVDQHLRGADRAGAPFVLGGDFNSLPPGDDPARLFRLLDEGARRRLDRVFEASHEGPPV